MSALFDEYIAMLPTKRKLSEAKFKIVKRLWGGDAVPFPKEWVTSSELLELTGQKYFDRRARELRDQLGCDIESAYSSELKGQAWRLVSSKLAVPQAREYLTIKQKNKLFEDAKFVCAICGLKVEAGVRGLQADHKIPLSRGGGNGLANWQPVCNTCNVVKRRACEGCDLNCSDCSWAFPENFAVVVTRFDRALLNQFEGHAVSIGFSKDELLVKIVEEYLKENR
ncbi:MAG: HNH endonuclease [Halodesulfovibrio sp.]|uniref:HNH endonuclease n=1 Tax=Halodesulfovibrio sp. TaxID=1912772 RepID=UPI00359E122D